MEMPERDRQLYSHIKTTNGFYKFQNKSNLHYMPDYVMNDILLNGAVFLSSKLSIMYQHLVNQVRIHIC